MKKIIVAIIVFALITITVLQVKRYRRFHPPEEYEYTSNTKDIDANYHNQALVDEYFKKAFEVGSFARQSWYNYTIDVRHPDEGSKHSMQAAARYNHMLSRLKTIETKLKASKQLKAKGYDNKAIAYIEKHGISPSQYKYHRLFEGKAFKVGDKNNLIWEYQKLLRKQGYKIETDGVFSEETKEATKRFQTKKGLYPSGNADRLTLQMLIK